MLISAGVFDRAQMAPTRGGWGLAFSLLVFYGPFAMLATTVCVFGEDSFLLEMANGKHSYAPCYENKSTKCCNV